MKYIGEVRKGVDDKMSLCCLGVEEGKGGTLVAIVFNPPIWESSFLLFAMARNGFGVPPSL